ncbi:hypothetical protein EPI10_000353 [Gossypium australe]|uniref:Uncharacterized protein n=1 Tax=Gossypium australe TaxID=47621 RepID=A0A5B6V7M3_9ROSI|nr:hypothetical protein EPI10_000353 [Gossypium australe]
MNLLIVHSIYYKSEVQSTCCGVMTIHSNVKYGVIIYSMEDNKPMIDNRYPIIERDLPQFVLANGVLLDT